MNTEYLKYSSEDFAQDDHFIRWVQADQPEGQWSRWIHEHPEISDTIKKATSIVTSIQFSQSQKQWDTDALWQRINNTLAEESTQETQVITMPRRRSVRWLGYAAAAAIVGAFAFQVWMSGDQSFYASKGDQLAHILPDESSIHINADSKITYNKRRWEDERTLTLEGEAFFEVQKGKSFKVVTDHGTVTVLGTAFNVYTRKDGFQVLCTEGRVEVTSDEDSVILNPNQKTHLHNGALVKTNTINTQPVDWMQGVYNFHDASLSSVLDAISRQFDVDILADSEIRDNVYNGSFRSDDLMDALEAVCFPMNLDSDVQGKTIYIKSKME